MPASRPDPCGPTNCLKSLRRMIVRRKRASMAAPSRLQLVPAVCVLAIGVAAGAGAQPISTVRTPRPISPELASKLKMELSLQAIFPKQTFATCDALVQAAQAEVFTLYTFGPADSVSNDVGCKASPIFAYAKRI